MAHVSRRGEKDGGRIVFVGTCHVRQNCDIGSLGLKGWNSNLSSVEHEKTTPRNRLGRKANGGRTN